MFQRARGHCRRTFNNCQRGVVAGAARQQVLHRLWLESSTARVQDLLTNVIGPSFTLANSCVDTWRTYSTHLQAGGLVGSAMHGEDRQVQLFPSLAQLPETLHPLD